jgi:hypothetical protein
MAKSSQASNSSEQELNPDIDLSLEDAGIGNEDSANFFESLDREVNGMILDKETDTVEPVATQQTQPKVDPEPPAQVDDHQHDWEKRYKDSSSEAKRLKSELDSVAEYQPLIARLKEDTGMVNAIKEYIDNGNKPKDVKQALNLPEDFVFDLDDAMANPTSLSAKALEHTISGVVDNRVNEKLQKERQTRSQETLKEKQLREADEFKGKYNISDTEYDDMMQWANNHSTSLEDIYYLKNRDSRDQKVAKGAKEDILKQMKSVRNIPQSVSNQNTVRTETKPEDEIFNAIKSVDEGLDGLFNME